MYPIRAISLSMGFLTLMVVRAAPISAITPDLVHPGTVMKAVPIHFDPLLPGNSVGTGAIRHPVIALSHPDANGMVPVVLVSHNHHQHMPQSSSANRYDHHSRNAGLGQFQAGSRIAVGHPTHVHVDDLHPVLRRPDPHNPGARFIPSKLHSQDTHKLKHAVYQASGKEYNNPPHPESPPPWRTIDPSWWSTT